MEQQNQYKQLYAKYLDSSISAKENEMLFQFIRSSTEQELDAFVDELLNDQEIPTDLSALVPHTHAQFKIVLQKINQAGVQVGPIQSEEATSIRQLPIKRIISIAATIVIACSIGIYGYLQNQKDKDRITAHMIDINPGGNKAILTLADGSTINLSDEQSGIIIGDEAIKYSDGSDLGTKESDSVGPLSVDQTSTLSLTTPKGGQYQITLPDGTKVWLNAASTLQYPAHFSGKERRVVLSGEAYFEVAKNTKQAFIVTSEEQEIKVLGTHFNINTFKDEGAILTTLVEGSVQISAGTHVRTLIPGQQSLVSGNSIKTRPVHTGEFTAWKDDLFIFKETRLKTILFTLSRWYDFKVDVSGVPDVILSGEILRNVNLSEVLNMLEATSDVQFKIVPDGINGTERRLIIEQ